jgi:hypothetical protein
MMFYLDTIKCECGEVYVARRRTERQCHDESDRCEVINIYDDDDRCPNCAGEPADGTILNSEEYVPEAMRDDK